jgi:pyridoxine/pyridoxamine 5'-phosphate oxidase
LWANGAFSFSTDPASAKGRNLAAQPNVVVHLESGDDVVIVEGQAERVTDPVVFEPLVDAYEQKYGIRLDPTDPHFGLYVVKPKAAYGWTEQSFPTTATRWRFSPD